MAKRQDKSANRELTAFVRNYPDVRTLELLIADVNGILRGKQIQRHEFEKCFADGFAMPGGTVLLDCQGDIVNGIGYSNEDGDPDLGARVVAGRLAPVPWSTAATGQTMFRFYGFDGKPFVADPRTVLERAIDKLRRRCPRIVMAVELEFYLLETRTDRPTPRMSRIPGLGRHQPGPQVYTPEELRDIEPFLESLHQTCEAQGIPAGTTTS
ncbi:MAG: glutamine synthetase, partial [Pseudomonadota bacterium]